MLRRSSIQFKTTALVAACCVASLCSCFCQSAKQPGPDHNDSLVKFLRSYLDATDANLESTEYFPAYADLRDNGTQEVIVYFTDVHSCGSGGCTTLILAPEGSSYKVVTEITIGWPPIRVLDSKSNGWHDLAVRVQGGGILHAYDAKLSFNGKSYPKNPSILPAIRLTAKTSGKIVVPTTAKGRLLN